MKYIKYKLSSHAANMTGHLSGIVTKVKNVGHPDLLPFHCIIHFEQLVVKRMSSALYEVLSNLIKNINEIRHKALNSRIFEAFCEEMGFQYTHLLLHTEMRWLSREKILTQLFAQHEDVKLLFRRKTIRNLKNFCPKISGWPSLHTW